MGGATLRRRARAVRRATSSSSNAASVSATAPRRATRARSSSAAFSARRRAGSTARAGLQPRQLLLCRRQHQALRRGADPLSRAGFCADRASPRARRPAGPSPMTSWSPGTARAEALYQVRGALGDDPTEPRAFDALSLSRRCPTSRRSPRCASAWQRVGLHPVFAAARRRYRTLAERARDALGRLSRHRHGKMDAETCGLAAALAHPNVELRTGAQGRAAAARRRTASAIDGVEVVDRRRARDDRAPSSSCSRPARSIRRRCCCAPPSAASPTAPTRSAGIS